MNQPFTKSYAELENNFICKLYLSATIYSVVGLKFT